MRQRFTSKRGVLIHRMYDFIIRLFARLGGHSQAMLHAGYLLARAALQLRIVHPCLLLSYFACAISLRERNHVVPDIETFVHERVCMFVCSHARAFATMHVCMDICVRACTYGCKIWICTICLFESCPSSREKL
jgi:hypothetical protein